MPKAHYIQNVFNAGQLSPLLDARSDLSKYANGCAVLRNFIPLVQGGVKRRPGTRFVAEVKDSSKSTRLVSFEFSETQAYVIEFGNQYLRFFKDNGQIESGGSPYEIGTSYLEADLFELKFAQSADVLYIAHPDYPPAKLERTSDTSWTLSDIDFQDGPFLSINNTATTLGLSATTGSVTVTASATAGINGGGGFQSSDVGRYIRWEDAAGNWTWLEITAVGTTTSVTATIRGDDASAATATTEWRLGVWSETTGYPAAVTFFEDRLWWGGGVEYPQRLDGSIIGGYETYQPSDKDGTVADDSGISVTLNANNVNVIRWLVDDEKGLLVGTIGGEWVVRASSRQEALTPANVTATRASSYGSSNQQPVRAGKAVLFVQRAARKLREMAYVFEDDGFRAPDLTLLSENITIDGIDEIAYQQEPQSVVWAVSGDGRLLGMTYERDQEVVGWHEHVLGGFSDSGDTVSAKVESASVIPSPDGTKDELWVVVQRYINGGIKRYVEYVTPLWDENTVLDDAFFVDSGLTYDGSETSTVSGAEHLQGETVAVLADGATHPDAVVDSGGQVSLDRAASVVHVGFAYSSNLQTMRPDVGAADGTAQSKIKRIDHVTLRFWRSLGAKTGPDASSLDTVVFRSASDPLNSAPPVFTGDKRVTWPSNYATNGQVYVRQDQPLPCNILGIVPRIVTMDR